MALAYPVTSQPNIGFQILQAASKLNALVGTGSRAIPGMAGAGAVTGPLGLALGGAQAAMGGNVPQYATNALTNPGTYQILAGAVGPEAFGGALAGPGLVGGAIGGLAAGAPLALGGLGMGIDSMISANNDKKAAERNFSRTSEAGGIMQALAQAVQSGNLQSEVQPGVRAGDLLSALASAAGSGSIAAGGDIYEEGLLPKGQYETLARRLQSQGYSGGMNIINNRGSGNVNNLAELIGAMDDRGPDTNRSGDAYGQVGSWLDHLSEGLQPAFGPEEALQRSALWQDTPTGGAALLGARRNELMGLGQPTDPRTVLSSYLNDPEKISVTNHGLRSQLTQAAQGLGIAVPDFEQQQLQRDQRLGIGAWAPPQVG